MLAVLEVNFPFFALVGAGYLVTRRGWMPLEAITGLNSFVLFFALPCMLFRYGAGSPVGQLLNPAALLVYLVAALMLAAAAVRLSLNEQVRWNDAAFGALVAVFPNTGFMGVPLLVALLGAQAAGPAAATMLVDMVVTTSLCIAASRWDAAGAHGARVAARQALRGVASNPLPWAILAGVAASAVGLALPAPVDRTLALLADAASPVALFTIGAVLARAQIVAARQAHPPMPARDWLPLVLVKLLLHPLLVWAIGSLAIALGLPLAPDTLLVLVLVAALPSASNVVLLAERYGADSARIVRIVMVTTAAAFISFSAAVALLR